MSACYKHQRVIACTIVWLDVLVMETIAERRETSKALSRPKSAPTNHLYRSQASIDSDFGVSEYFDKDTSNVVSVAGYYHAIFTINMYNPADLHTAPLLNLLVIALLS